MSEYFDRDCDLDISGILQGDIFKIGNQCHDIFLPEEVFAVVITADCDIEKKKMGKCFTMLPVISAKDYFLSHWLLDIFKKEMSKIVSEVCQIINKKILTGQEGFDEVTEEGILEWISESGLKYILEVNDIEIVGNVEQLLVRYEIVSKKPSFEGYSSLAELNGKKAKAIRGDLSGAIKNAREEFYYIPTVPGGEPLGYMIRLRDVKAISTDRVLQSRVFLNFFKN